jgi:hypothetical protein
MAIAQAMCTSFKKALLDGEMDFSSNTGQSYKIALYTSSASLDAATAAYTTSGEVSSANNSGYTTGGNALTIVVPAVNGTTAFLSFANTTWNTASFTARGALIYQVGGTTPAVAVLNFGTDKTASGGTFQITFPAVNASNAIIRIA